MHEHIYAACRVYFQVCRCLSFSLRMVFVNVACKLVNCINCMCDRINCVDGFNSQASFINEMIKGYNCVSGESEVWSIILWSLSSLMKNGSCRIHSVKWPSKSEYHAKEIVQQKWLNKFSKNNKDVEINKLFLYIKLGSELNCLDINQGPNHELWYSSFKDLFQN